MIRSITVAVLLFSSFAAAGSPSNEPVNLSLADLQGQQHSLSDYRGKVLVVNFWATWCGPCKHEMPLFSDALKRYGSDRVQMVAVSLDDESTRNKISTFAEKEKMTFPILLGTTETMQKLGLGEALPATIFFDPDGRVIARVLGEINKSELKARLEYLLGQSSKQPPELVNNLGKKSEQDITPVMH